MAVSVKVFLNAILLLLITACSIGEDGSYYSSVDDTNTTPASTLTTSSTTSVSFSGVVVDGYISGATVCLDINQNGICDSGEPTKTSNLDGTFTFSEVELTDSSFIPIIASGGTDTATDKPFVGELQNIIDTDAIATTPSLIVSPLTDLMATSFLKTEAKNRYELDSSIAEIAEAFNINSDDINVDPMSNVLIFAKTQEIQQIKALVETTAKRSITSSLSEADELELLNEIKEAMVIEIQNSSGATLDVDEVLNEVEILSEISIPTSDRTFVSGQTAEVRTMLDTLDESIGVGTLDELQSGLEVEVDDSLSTFTVTAISDATTLVETTVAQEETTTPTVVEDDTTTVLADDDTTEPTVVVESGDSIYDPNACDGNANDYKSISHNAFHLGSTSDENITFTLTTKYDKDSLVSGSTVSLFYPTFNFSKSGSPVYINATNYKFTFDTAWVENSNRTIYIQLPPDTSGDQECYRYELDSINSSEITAVLVHR